MEAGATTYDGVWTPGRRALTLGLVFTITLVGFEGLAVATILKVIDDDLHDITLIGWVFSAFFLGSLFGVVAAGYDADRVGPARPFVVGLVLFAIGLGSGGLAPNMIVLVSARVLQGIGAGAIPAVAYVAIGRALPERVATAHVRGVVDRVGAARGSSGPAISGGRGRDLRLALGVPRPPAAGRARGGHDDPRARSRSVRRAARNPSIAGSARWCSSSAPALVLGGASSHSVSSARRLVVVGVVIGARAFLRLVPRAPCGSRGPSRRGRAPRPR